jgi:hypothetical protein
VKQRVDRSGRARKSHAATGEITQAAALSTLVRNVAKAVAAYPAMGWRALAVDECELKRPGPRSRRASPLILMMVALHIAKGPGWPGQLRRNCPWKPRRSTLETTDP